MRKLSTNSDSDGLKYWQCIVPSVLAKFIDVFPSGESLFYYAKIVADGLKLDMENEKMFRYARYQEATLKYLAHTQTEEDYKSMSRFYIPIIYSLVKRIDKLSPIAFALLFQQFIKFASLIEKPKDDDELVAIVTVYIKQVLKNGNSE